MSRNLKRSSRNFLPKFAPKFASKFSPKFPVLSWQVEKSSPQISPDFSIGDFKSNSKSNFTQNFTNTLLQAWQPYNKLSGISQKISQTHFCRLGSPTTNSQGSSRGVLQAGFKIIRYIYSLITVSLRDGQKYPQYCWEFHERLSEALSGTTSEKRSVPRGTGEGDNSGNALEPSNVFNYRVWGIPAVLSSGIPEKALRAFPGSFRIFRNFFLKVQAVLGYGPDGYIQ